MSISEAIKLSKEMTSYLKKIKEGDLSYLDTLLLCHYEISDFLENLEEFWYEEE